MLNETQEAAFQNLLVLGESNPAEISLHNITLDDAVDLGRQLLGGHEWDRPTIGRSTIDETFIVRGRIPDTQIDFVFFCLPHLSETPFGPVEETEQVF